MYRRRSYWKGSNATTVTIRGLTGPHAGDGAQLLTTVFVAGSHTRSRFVSENRERRAASVSITAAR